MYQGLLLPDGPSDMPLSSLLERMCLDFGASVAVTAVDPRRLKSSGHSVEGRLAFLAEAGVEADLVFIHRDAEKDPLGDRRAEILTRATVATPTTVVPVVPVRMTEAWLLLDEGAIRAVAGKPNGKAPLGLPKPRNVESVADPKDCLMRAILAASEATGRNRARVERSFGRNRRVLLERLDMTGPVRDLPAWSQLQSDVQLAVQALMSGRP